MNLQEYKKLLDSINRELDKTGKIQDDVSARLDYLYNFKPVLTRWHQVKCKALIKSGQTTEIIERFGDKISKEYVFDGNVELWQQLVDVYLMTNQELEGQRQQYMLHKLTKNLMYQQEDNKLQSVRQQFMEGNETAEILKELEQMFYVTCNRFLAYAVYVFSVKKYPELEDVKKNDFYASIDNLAYIIERMEDKTPVILISDEVARENYDILAYILHKLGIPVYMITDMVSIEGDFNLKDTVGISLDNCQEYEDCVAIPAIEKEIGDGRLENNIPYIIDFICKNQTENDFSIIIASNEKLEKLRKHSEISKRFERLSSYEASYIENEVGFAWCGDYYTYISYLYGYDVRESVNRLPECEFSIVIPVRNATETLYHTLRTCLEQDYKGKYEVVLSDNSTSENTMAYDIYVKLNDERIRYYKTPRDLNLTKSYEYAYLQTRGKYIFSIGGDDGVLPWALRSLDCVWKQGNATDRNIIRWDRGFYAWPGFNGGQENQFSIPKCYHKDKIEVAIEPGNSYLGVLKVNPDMMYLLPNMYINSGFRREYMKVLYEKTGSLWNGSAQDIYMGVQNVAINSEILHIKYPLTIAGMSNSSVGTTCMLLGSKGSVEVKRNYELMRGGKGIYAFEWLQEPQDFPNLASDVSGMYLSVARLMAKGILPSNYYNEEDVQSVFKNCYDKLSILNDKYDKHICEGYDKAKRKGLRFQKWYEREILRNAYKFIYVDDRQLEVNKAQKTYAEGFDVNGGVTLDASRYGVTNIYEAVQLFKNFLHF